MYICKYVRQIHALRSENSGQRAYFNSILILINNN